MAVVSRVRLYYSMDEDFPAVLQQCASIVIPGGDPESSDLKSIYYWIPAPGLLSAGTSFAGMTLKDFYQGFLKLIAGTGTAKGIIKIERRGQLLRVGASNKGRTFIMVCSDPVSFTYASV